MITGSITNLDKEFEKITTYWSPVILELFNEQYFKIAKLKDEFVWHDHENEDELFYVYKGSLRIEYRDSVVNLKQGDIHVVPRGVEHFPVAIDECWVVFIEPVSTSHTGKVIDPRTKSVKDQLSK
jgi:mannose-6-phosphate isomerase-like protein (cupin superfamily)